MKSILTICIDSDVKAKLKDVMRKKKISISREINEHLKKVIASQEKTEEAVS